MGKKTDITVTAKRNQEEIMGDWGGGASPLVSICCITYNHVSYIMEAIDSFLMQETTFPFEILIHDDASTDGTTDIIIDYANKYPDIIRTIIQTENQYSKGGLIYPRFVFPKARGKYIALCEGDDYWTDKTKLQKQVNFLENNPDYVITYTDSQPFDESGKLKINFGGATRDLSADELQKSTPIYTLTTCFRNIIKEIPQDLMSARFGDCIIWSLLGAHGRGKYLSDIEPAAYRVHDGGIFSKKTIKRKYEMAVITKAALFAYYSRISNNELANYFKIKTFKLCLRLIGIYGLILIGYDFLMEKIIHCCFRWEKK
jgi:glycosyltransferase involved in cell wall biosynthesis